MAAASTRPGEKPSSFAVACSLLSLYVRQNGGAAAELSLGFSKGDADAQRTKSSLLGAEGEEPGMKKETMELFPQSAGLGSVQDASTPDAVARRQLTVNWSEQPVPAPVTDNKKVETVVPAPASSLPGAQTDAHKPAHPNAADLPIARKASLHRFLEKRNDRLHAKAPYASSPSDEPPVKKEPESQPWLGLGQNAAAKPEF
ncbi:hypothetical protein BRADI_2g05850v3 [Brachypodium distachyon]|uniref:Uncharacterized protein n=1 Tax=Brachypodium distachyon TaxID=15368 RepID=A0A0Q3IRY6_BRADI|nr:hypothetical protein BRADI_2g05850v3 [Brachypodium distachyon]